MNAKEARKKAAAANINEYAELMIKIRAAIDSAAIRGEYHTVFYDPVPKDIRVILHEEGYEVGETQHWRGESLTPISWENVTP